MVYRPRSAYVEYFVVPDGLNAPVSEVVGVCSGYRRVVMVAAKQTYVIRVVTRYWREPKTHIPDLNKILLGLFIFPRVDVLHDANRYLSELLDFGVDIPNEGYLSIQLD